jgi:hypothetical protein
MGDSMKKSLEKFNEQLQRKSWTEWYSSKLPAVRAIVQAIPYIGGPLDTILAMPGQLFQQERVELLFRYIGEVLSRVDQEYVKTEWVYSDEFRDLLVQAIESSIRTRSEEKIRINAMILTNVLIVPNDGRFLPEEYMKALADLTPIEVKALLVFYKAFEDLQSNLTDNELQRATKTGWKERLQNECGIDPEDVIFLMKRLERTGFVSEITGAYLGYGGGQFYPTESLKRLMEYLSLNPLSKVS